jgi:hypothetical protein
MLTVRLFSAVVKQKNMRHSKTELNQKKPQPQAGAFYLPPFAFFKTFPIFTMSDFLSFIYG